MKSAAFAKNVANEWLTCGFASAAFRHANRGLRLGDASFLNRGFATCAPQQFLPRSFLGRPFSKCRCLAAPSRALQKRAWSQLLLWRASFYAPIEAPVAVTESGSGSRRQNSGTYSRYPFFVYGFLDHFWYPQVGPAKPTQLGHKMLAASLLDFLLLLRATPDDGNAMLQNLFGDGGRGST